MNSDRGVALQQQTACTTFPSLRAAARFAADTPSVTADTAALLSDDVMEQRSRVRELIERVAQESDRVQADLTYTAISKRLQGATRTATASRQFNLMRGGEVVANVPKGATLHLVEAN